MKKPLTDQEIFTRLSEGKAVQAEDGTIYYCSEGRLIYHNGRVVDWNLSGFSTDFTYDAFREDRASFTRCRRPLKRTYKHLLNRGT